ncbi:hypothetical protein N9L68_02755 [bacterium]|nr:hypothetical protein [bacterium]
MQISSSLKSLSLIPDEANRGDRHVHDAGSRRGPRVSSPEANAHELQSQQVVNMLQELRDKLIDERKSLEKEEMDYLHAVELLMQDLKHEIEVATEESNATKLPAKSDAEGDLADASGTHDADVT